MLPEPRHEPRSAPSPLEKLNGWSIVTRTRLDPRNPLTRASAWLADIDDWDANDADVFVATVERAEVAEETRHVPAAG